MAGNRQVTGKPATCLAMVNLRVSFFIICHGPRNCYAKPKACFWNVSVSHNSCIFSLDIFSYLLFNFNDYPSGMVTLFNLLVMGNWQVWMEVRIFLCSIKWIKVARIVFLINAKTSGKNTEQIFVFANLCFFIFLSNTFRVIGNWLEVLGAWFILSAFTLFQYYYCLIW